MLLATTAFSVFAYDFSAVAPSRQTLYYNIVNGNAQVTSQEGYNISSFPQYSNLSGALIIPDSVTYNSTTYAVTSIDNYAFGNCSSLTSVTIPNSVTSIGNSAFYGCSGLTFVTIPNSVSNISRYAFYGCSGLTSVTIPTSVTSIEYSAFNGCSGLTFVTIPNSVTSIGVESFSDCRGLISVTIPNSVISIDNSAFNGCSSLTSIFVSTGNTRYDSRNNCNAIIKTSSNTLIQGCKNTTIPNSVTSIGHDAFGGCSSLTSLTIPTSVTSIDYNAFYGCSGLTSLTIPTTVTSIGYNAFYGCSGLTSLTIPNSVTSIGNYAFYHCSGLTSVSIGNSVTSIGHFVFYGCRSLTSVTIPNSVTSIGNWAFCGCNGLTSVTIGKSVASIGKYAFSGCSGLTEIHSLSQVAPTLGENAFNGVSSTFLVYVPCGRSSHYYAQWSYFSNIMEEVAFSFSAESADDNMGMVQILTMPTCTVPNAVLYAVPNNGYHFDHWSTGSTNNPFTLTVTTDTVITAYFVSDSDTEGIDDINTSDIRVYSVDGHIVVDDAKGETVHIHDMMGREVFRANDADKTSALPGGVYLVKIGNHPARKVVVIR